MSEIKTVHTDNAPKAIGPYSQAKIFGELLFASGQIPADPVSGDIIGDDIASQSEQIMKNIGAILAEAGSSFDKVIKTTCFLDNMDDFATFNAVYEKYFVSKPARSCVAVEKLPKGVLAEVEVIASL